METNSEPSGTDEDIHGGESAIDIFILCKDDRDSQQLIGQLTPQGYRITLFTESTDLLESIRAGKPNLLICDTTSPELDGYNVCREIKTDDDLWKIPVLLVTGVASLGDLLIVLDSNADNFIARPYDPPYLLSLVDLMLTSPVEKPDPEKIRTQFKIHHEDRDYVITADRRKLLEFLLSSFEMAVGRAAELGQTQRALDGLKSTLERRVVERTSELGTEIARLQTITNGQARDLETARNALAGQKKEGDALRSRLEERETVVTGTKAELATLTQELETTRARFAEAEDTIRTLGTEKDELEHALRGDAETLNRDLEQTRVDLTAAKKELAEVSGHREALETQLTGLTQDYEESKRALGTRSMEIEQLKSDLAGEKSRAEAAELEVKSVLLEKGRSEQDLRLMVEDITEKAKQQSQECLRLTDELAAEKDRRTRAEQQYSELAQEAAKKEAGFVAEKGTLMEHRDTLQQKYDTLTESVGAERQKSTTLESNLVRITSVKDQIAGELQALKERLDTTVASLEEEKRLRAGAETSVKEIAEAKDIEVRALNTSLGEVRQDLEKTRDDLKSAEQERDATAAAHKSLSDELASVVLAKAQSDKLTRSAASEMEQIREELETERRVRHDAEEKLSEVTLAKGNIEQTSNARCEQAAEKERELLAKVQDLSDNLTSEQEARRTAEEKLSEVTLAKGNIEQTVNARCEQAAEKERELLAKIQDLSDNLASEQEARRTAEEKLSEVTLAKGNIEQTVNARCEQAAEKERELLAKVQDLSDNLASEQEARRTAEEKLSEVTLAKGNIEQTVNARCEQAAAKERELLAKVQDLSDNLISEREAHSTAEETLARVAREKELVEQQLRAITGTKATEDAHREANLKKLGDDLKIALDRQRSLEEQLRDAEREQATKEAALRALSTEIEEADAALAAEKEERHAAQEECAVAKDALAALRKSTRISPAIIEEIPVQNHAMVAKGPDLPAVIMHGPQALSRKEINFPVPVQQPALAHLKKTEAPAGTGASQVRIQSVEDLFEESKELDVSDLPDATPVSAVPGDVGERDLFEPDVNNETDTPGDNSIEPDAGEPGEAGNIAAGKETGDDETGETGGEPTSGGDQVPETISPAFSRQQWFDLMKWAHNTDALTHADRIKIVKLGRLLQRGRRITGRQEAQLEELVTLAFTKGYRPKE
ncbi:response regulator [Methanoregula sp.]|uniref:response regulator n=1 Tax=Methanoregula sp. TaxID=2052170 RepID=UPI00356710B1